MSQGGNDLQQLTNTVAGKIDEGTRKAKSFFISACIYRVPEDLRKLNERAYTPRLIAIGPLHREDKHLQTSLQHVKLSYTNYLFLRLTEGRDRDSAVQTKFTVLQKCLAEMKTSIDKAKKFYAEEVTLDEEMMLVDGCFILEFLYRCRTGVPERDPIFCNNLTFCKVQTDLVLLENQIPFFVLEKLFGLTVGQIPNRPHDENWSLPDYVKCCYKGRMIPLPNSDNSSSSSAKTRCSPRDCVLSIFGDKWVNSTTKEEGQKEEELEDRNAHSYHILHNLHDGFLPHDQTEKTKFNYRDMPSASELVYAGVKFVPYPGNDLFKFKFTESKGLFWWCHRARFKIPPLAIYDETESYLRNLIAFEQCCPDVLRHVSSYAGVMDTLVNADKDIQVLEKAGVLRNHLGASQDATDLFNNLCKEIVFGDYFLETCEEATKYSKHFWPKNMAHVSRTYLASPWTFIAFVVGFFAFVFSLVGFVRGFSKNG